MEWKSNNLLINSVFFLQDSSNFDILSIYTFQQHYLNVAECLMLPGFMAMIITRNKMLPYAAKIERVNPKIEVTAAEF